MAISVNFSDIELKDFDPVPRGQYLVELVEVEEKVAQTELATHYMKCKFEIKDPEEYVGRFVWDNLMLEGKGMFRLKSALLAAGFTNDELEAGLEFEPQDLVSSEFVLALSIRRSEEYGDQNTVQKYLPA